MEYVHSQTEGLEYDLEEAELEFKGRKILYLISEMRDGFTLGCDQSYVSPSQTRTVYIIGEIMKWKYEAQDGRTVSEVESITSDQDEIKNVLESSCGTSNVYFR